MPDIPEAAKDRGHLAELLFGVGAKQRGLIVCTPGGDNCPFDVALYNGAGRFIRVQVKSCFTGGRARHAWTVKRGSPKTKRSYTKLDVDILALYSFDDNVWHLVPVEVIGSETTINIVEGGKYDIFKNNWDILK